MELASVAASTCYLHDKQLTKTIGDSIQNIAVFTILAEKKLLEDVNVTLRQAITLVMRGDEIPGLCDKLGSSQSFDCSFLNSKWRGILTSNKKKAKDRI